MKFEYQLTGAGWARGYIEIDDQKRSLTAGYLTDALGDLLEALLNLNPLYTQAVYLKHGRYFMWEAEPDGVQWHLRRVDKEKISIKITYYEDTSLYTGEREELDAECSYDEFLKEVMREAESIFKEYGIVGYKENWIEHEFPLSTFLQLKYYLDTKTKYPINRNDLEDNKLYKSDLSKDMDYLKK
ncbi:hypothetical protein [Anoxybacteroides tepidamans]|uniref:hypothetical protein n=1 Tax=Anoxybacteroides tepidamans TaxID=265948 RepID=UPI0006891651|nr:hypothetical protein [Anoxybacillus tepidamans]